MSVVLVHKVGFFLYIPTQIGVTKGFIYICLSILPGHIQPYTKPLKRHNYE